MPVSTSESAISLKFVYTFYLFSYNDLATGLFVGPQTGNSHLRNKLNIIQSKLQAKAVMLSKFDKAPLYGDCRDTELRFLCYKQILSKEIP